MFDINEYFNTIPLATEAQYISIQQGSEISVLYGEPVNEAETFPDWFERAYIDSKSGIDPDIPENLSGVFQINRKEEHKFFHEVGNTFTVENDLNEMHQLAISKEPELVKHFTNRFDLKDGERYTIVVMCIDDIKEVTLYKGNVFIKHAEDGGIDVMSKGDADLLHKGNYEGIPENTTIAFFIPLTYRQEHTLVSVA